jgi:hypothetical protein
VAEEWTVGIRGDPWEGGLKGRVGWGWDWGKVRRNSEQGN